MGRREGGGGNGRERFEHAYENPTIEHATVEQLTHQIFKDLFKDGLGGVREVAHREIVRGGGTVHHVLRLMTEVATKL